MLMVWPILAVASVLLLVWQLVAAWRFPLHRRISDKSYQPGVTILKPLKGLDTKLMDSLRTWITQDYNGPVQVLFGVASPEDPACEVVRQLLRENPGRNCELVICPESLGLNGKVSSLIQMQRLARHDITVVSDADVVAPADFLVNAVALLREPNNGLVNCFYRLANPRTPAARCEAVAINADFWSQVLQGAAMQPLDFALGAVMITRREQLKEIGGFEALVDYLADDYQLGNRVAAAGKEIALCPVVVDCEAHALSWGEMWEHQLRWARTIRACKPWPYAASLISNATLWPLLWLVLQPGTKSLEFFAIAMLLRIVSAQMLQRRLGAVPGQGWYFWLAPVKDLMQFGLWLGAFAGGRIVWRGQEYYLQPDGRLTEEFQPTPGLSAIQPPNAPEEERRKPITVDLR
jgi:ceramide glucosyltransferase